MNVLHISSTSSRISVEKIKQNTFLILLVHEPLPITDYEAPGTEKMVLKTTKKHNHELVPALGHILHN